MLFQKNFENLVSINPKIKEFETELYKLKDCKAPEKSLESFKVIFLCGLKARQHNKASRPNSYQDLKDVKVA